MKQTPENMPVRWEEFCDNLQEHEKPRDTKEALRMKIAWAAGGSAVVAELQKLRAEQGDS